MERAIIERNSKFKSSNKEQLLLILIIFWKETNVCLFKMDEEFKVG